MRSYDSLKRLSDTMNLRAPERITSITMRKYCATHTQVYVYLNMSIRALITYNCCGRDGVKYRADPVGN